MRCSLDVAMMVAVLAVSVAWAAAQAPDYSNVGRTPSAQEIKTADTSIGIEGKELPPGSGTAKEGAQIYAKKCAGCHGQNLEGVPSPGGGLLGPRLAGGQGTLNTAHPVKTVGSFWPYATAVWDYISRAMPRRQEGAGGGREPGHHA